MAVKRVLLVHMAQVDERDAQALEELRKIESKIVNYRTRMKLVRDNRGEVP